MIIYNVYTLYKRCTIYTYGLERISALTAKTKTEYVYDGRGSVAAEVSYSNAWYTLGGALSKKDVTAKSYTPFGEQIGEAVSGFGYNGEYYNAATGMVYLRARFYEPEMNRFSQKDVVRGSITSPASLNRYTYVQNDPINFIDPSGQSLKSFVGSVASKVSSTAKSVASAAKSVAKSVASTSKSTASSAYTSANSAAQAAQAAAKASATSAATAKANSAASMAYMYANEARMTGSGVAATKAAQAASQAYSYANEARMSSNSSISGYGSASSAYTGYYNSSYETGKIPSTDAPRIKDVTANDAYYCNASGRIGNIQAFGAGDYGAEALGNYWEKIYELADQSTDPYDFYVGSYNEFGNSSVNGIYAGIDLPNLDGGINMVNAGVGIANVAGDGNVLHGELDAVTADARAGISKEYVGAQIGGRLIRGELGVKVPVSSDEYLYIGVEGELFAIGGKLYFNPQKREFKIGASALIGGGILISIEDK